MKTDKYELGEGNELTIKILYDPEDPGMWYNVKINKLNGDEETEEWLKENNAAVLKYMIETAAKQDKSFIGRNDWPKGVNGGAKAYKQIRKFLGKYGENLVSKGGRGHGVYWKGTPRLILGETEKSQRDTEEVFNGIIEDISRKEKIKKEEKFGGEITDLLAETARELCEKGRRSGRLIAPANIPKSQKVKLPELHAEAELTQGEQIKTLRQLIDELSSDGELIGVFVTGSGGSGKTFSLLDYAHSELNKPPSPAQKRRPIPIYISLNQLNTTENTYIGIENIILNNLYGLSADDSTKKKRREQYYSWIQSEDEQFYPLLMLDGFNEVTDSDIKDRLVAEVNDMQNRTNSPYRFIITSRYDLSAAFSKRSGNSLGSQFQAYSVSDLRDTDITEHVKKYLRSMNWQENRIRDVIQNELMELDLRSNEMKVKEFLKKPMAIVLFCYMHEPVDGFSEAVDNRPINTLGELLSAFVAKVKLGNSSKKAVKDRDEQFLRYLGYRMNSDGVFTVSGMRYRRYCDDFLSTHGEYTFNEQDFYKSSFIKDILNIPKDLKEISYRHQNYRDYFAADFLRQFIVGGDVRQLYLINEYFGHAQIPQEVLVILADLLGEYNCIDNGEESVIQSYFTNYLKERSDYPYDTPEISAAAAAELIHVAAIGRKGDLSAFDFSGIDLSCARLNSIKLSRGEDNGPEHTARFVESILSKDTLNAAGHAGAVQMMLYVNPCLITFSKRGFFAFSMRDRVQYHIADYYESAVDAGILLDNLSEIITGDRAGRLVRWRYAFDSSWKISLEKLSEITMPPCEASSLRRKNNSIQSIVSWNGGLIVTLKCGDVYYCDSGLTDFRLLTRFVQPDGETIKDAFKKRCIASACHRSLYVSYGNEIRRFIEGSEEYTALTADIGKAYIYDIGTLGLKNTNKTEFLFVNVSDMETDAKVKASELLWSVDFRKLRVLHVQQHSTTKQGFKGWNRFSPQENGDIKKTGRAGYRYSIYISSNIEDTQDEPGFYEISVSLENYLRNTVPRLIPHYGNRHRMSVEYVLPFSYSGQNYVATGSVDRCAEIIKVGGGEDAFIHHLAGHTDGIHYMDIVNDCKMFTAHYSGEVCVWQYIPTLAQWKCRHVVQAHQHWVWETKHIRRGDSTYILSCSYDHRVSIINEETERIWFITEPKGRILTFEVYGNFVIVAYDYTLICDGVRQSRAVLQKFRIDDFENGRYTAGNELVMNQQIRFMRRIDDFILMCTTDVTPGLIYRTTCNSDSITTVAPDAIRKLNSPHNLYLRTIDAVRHDNGYFFAAAGDSGEKHIIEIWNESLSTVIYPEYERGISTLCMSMFAGRYYLFSASYDGTISGYELNSDEESITFRPICTCHHSDQVLHIQASGNKLYVSLLSGKVFAWNIRDILGECERQFSENEAALLFHTITGLNICNVDFSLSNTDDWDEAFSSIVRYYEYTE